MSEWVTALFNKIPHDVIIRDVGGNYNYVHVHVHVSMLGSMRCWG